MFIYKYQYFSTYLSSFKVTKYEMKQRADRNDEIFVPLGLFQMVSIYQAGSTIKEASILHLD